MVSWRRGFSLRRSARWSLSLDAYSWFVRYLRSGKWRIWMHDRIHFDGFILALLRWSTVLAILELHVRKPLESISLIPWRLLIFLKFLAEFTIILLANLAVDRSKPVCRLVGPARWRLVDLTQWQLMNLLLRNRVLPGQLISRSQLLLDFKVEFFSFIRDTDFRQVLLIISCFGHLNTQNAGDWLKNSSEGREYLHGLFSTHFLVCLVFNLLHLPDNFLHHDWKPVLNFITFLLCFDVSLIE